MLLAPSSTAGAFPSYFVRTFAMPVSICSAEAGGVAQLPSGGRGWESFHPVLFEKPNREVAEMDISTD